MVRSISCGLSPRPTESEPCGSKSTSSTLRPNSASEAPRLMVVVVLPTPPFWLHIEITRAPPWRGQRRGLGELRHRPAGRADRRVRRRRRAGSARGRSKGIGWVTGCSSRGEGWVCAGCGRRTMGGISGALLPCCPNPGNLPPLMTTPPRVDCPDSTTPEGSNFVDTATDPGWTRRDSRAASPGPQQRWESHRPGRKSVHEPPVRCTGTVVPVHKPVHSRSR